MNFNKIDKCSYLSLSYMILEHTILAEHQKYSPEHRYIQMELTKYRKCICSIFPCQDAEFFRHNDLHKDSAPGFPLCFELLLSLQQIVLALQKLIETIDVRLCLFL
jgi:hypothetical protein